MLSEGRKERGLNLEKAHRGGKAIIE